MNNEQNTKARIASVKKNKPSSSVEQEVLDDWEFWHLTFGHRPLLPFVDSLKIHPKYLNNPVLLNKMLAVDNSRCVVCRLGKQIYTPPSSNPFPCKGILDMICADSVPLPVASPAPEKWTIWVVVMDMWSRYITVLSWDADTFSEN